MKTRIMVDSSADVRQTIKQDIPSVPLTVRFGTNEFTDGVTITKEEFYERLIESDVLPTTSQATPFAFSEKYEEYINAGEDIIVITVSSKLSGTYQSACIAASDYPNRVYVIDSESAAIGAGILAELGLQLSNEGKSTQEIYKTLEKEKKNICLIALLNTLEYLKKGGRISATVAIAGEMFSIKPVITIKDGEISVLGKARGSKQGNNFLKKQIQANIPDFHKPFILGYTGTNDDLLKKYMKDSADLWGAYTNRLDAELITGVIGTHVGPGAIAVAYFKK